MDSHSFMANVVVYLAAAVLAVPLFRALRLGAVLGYLSAGAVIGPWGIGLIDNAENILHFAELGVVLLLFVIGLELEPSRLWSMRRSVFGVGGLQVGVTGVVIALLALAFGVPATAAGVVGLSLALSSTAFALQLLGEKNQLRTQHGQISFSILLFQDLAVIPVLALIPLLGHKSDALPDSDAASALEVVAVIAAIIVCGRYLLRPVFRAIARTRQREIFTAAALLLVLGIALLMQSIGLSMALGTFLAGVLLADSEYRHELEADIEPFKGLLLGLFFIAVGMSADLSLIAAHPVLVTALTLGLLMVKLTLLYGLGWVTGLSSESRRGLAFVLPQGGEFGFVIFGVATSAQVMDTALADLLIVVVTLSMALTPLIFGLNQRFLKRYSDLSERPFDSIEPEDSQVVVAGYGRVGQVISRVLRVHGVGFTALEHSPDQVDMARRFGNKLYYGDAARLDLLHAAGTADAKLFVLAIDDPETSVRVAEMVRKHFPKTPILARARNRQHAFDLMDLGVTRVWRETLLSSGDMARAVLVDLGVEADSAADFVERFLAHDAEILTEQHKRHHDAPALLSYSKQASEQLEQTLSADGRR
ncbi:monovalent cation:proton antiporter-2 (CPA2) family protein [Haliangium sp.]